MEIEQILLILFVNNYCLLFNSTPSTLLNKKKNDQFRNVQKN